MTPYDLGLGKSVRFDHDFHGREALERHAAAPRRRKVTLLWNAEDVADVVRSQLEPGTPAKFLDFPKARYGLFQMDEVRQGDQLVGISTDAGYVAFDQLYMSLATLDVDVADGAAGRGRVGREPDLGQAPGRRRPSPGAHPGHGGARAVPRLRPDGVPRERLRRRTARPGFR